jgi:hypothetical protein
MDTRFYCGLHTEVYTFILSLTPSAHLEQIHYKNRLKFSIVEKIIVLSIIKLMRWKCRLKFVQMKLKETDYELQYYVGIRLG